MSNLKHYRKLILKILASEYPYGKIRLLLNYLKLISKSAIRHKLPFAFPAKKKGDTYCESIMSFKIHFFSYTQLINLFEEIYIYQVYQHSQLPNNPVIFDCGSNIGLSVMYLHQLNPSSRITAIEPDQATYDVLVSNIKKIS